MMKKSFTLLEAIVVVVIIGIVATLGLAQFGRALERNRSKQAETNLQLIYNAQKRRRLDTRFYFICEPQCQDVPGGPVIPDCSCNLYDINRILGIEIGDRYFTYVIEANGDGFRAIATRIGNGLCAGRTMTIMQDSGQVQKECEVWQ